MSALLEVRALRRRFDAPSGRRRRAARPLLAVDGVDLTLADGECLALVGESGSGKSTIARVILRLLPPDSGEIRYEGRDLLALRGRGLRAARRSLQGVLQDPLAALDPRVSAGRAIGEALEVHRIGGVRERPDAILRLLEEVGLDPALAARYPHELSGGERQRVALARALSTGPRLLVADEPLTALDAPTRGRMVELLAERRRARGLALLLIAHDLGPVRRLADRIAVLYLGRVVELGPAAEILARPRHPYTRALIAASTRGWSRRSGPDPVLGTEAEPPDPADPPAGCPYHPRCPLARDRCRIETPALRAGGPGTLVACHFPVESAPPPQQPS